MQPKFPLFVLFDDGDDWLLYTPDEVAFSLEWFDSEDGDNTVIVLDWEGRPVSVLVEALELKRLELLGQPHGARADVTPARLERLRLQAA